MPANNTSGVVHYWAGRLPGMVGLIHSPSPGVAVQKLRSYQPYFPYAIDNYRFVSCARGIEWDASIFLDLLGWVKFLPTKPLFVVVPDIWGDARATAEEWQAWEPKLRAYGFPLAFVIQDGMKLDKVPPTADWLFVGGSDQWRYPRLKDILAIGKPVHVGRVNSKKYLWVCHDLGVTSCDGSGWFRGDQKQNQDLLEFWAYLAGDIPKPGSDQLSLNLELV